MMRAAVGAKPAVRDEQSIQLGDHGALRGSRLEGDGHLVEGALHVEGLGQFLVIHPHHRERAVVGQRGPRRRLKHKLRREHDPRDAQRHLPSIEDRRKLIARTQPVNLRKRLADEDLSPRLRLEHSPTPQVQPVQQGLTPLGHRGEPRHHRLRQSREVDRHHATHGRLHRHDPGNLRDAARDIVGGALHTREDIGETVLLVVAGPRALERNDETARHHHHRQAARHHERHGQRLGLQGAEIAEEFAVEEGHVSGRRSAAVTKRAC
jgi:hypothetical protein